MATKLEKVENEINDMFRYCLDPAFKNKFGIELKTEFDLMAMTLISVRVDGKKLTKTQIGWMEAYSEGYMAAWGVVSKARAKE